MKPPSAGFAGTNWFQSGGSDFKNLDFVMRAVLAGNSHGSIVQVQSVSNAGAASPVGVVSAKPMVDQVDGFGNQTPHGVIYNLPYFRLQGGGNAIIADPQVGDIGAALICDRDISVIKTTKAPGGPGSRRQNSKSDGLYIGGFLNGSPTQFLQFLQAAVNLISLSTIGITAPSSVLFTSPSVSTTGNLVAGTGTTATVSTSTGQVLTFHDGILINVD